MIISYGFRSEIKRVRVVRGVRLGVVLALVLARARANVTGRQLEPRGLKIYL